MSNTTASQIPLTANQIEKLVSDQVILNERIRNKRIITQIVSGSTIILALLGLFSWFIVSTYDNVRRSLELAERIANATAEKTASDAIQRAFDSRGQLILDLNRRTREAEDALISTRASQAVIAERVTVLAAFIERTERALAEHSERLRARESDLNQLTALTRATDVLTNIREDVVKIITTDGAFRQSIAQAVNPLPRDFVVAFAGSAGCPDGWRDYVQARGRFIVGAGESAQSWNPLGPDGRPGAPVPLSAYGLGQTGGEERHQLTIDEMPAHNHGGGIAGTSTTQVSSPGAVNNGVMIPRQINTEGGGRPHNVIPPYIALFYCTR